MIQPYLMTYFVTCYTLQLCYYSKYFNLDKKYPSKGKRYAKIPRRHCFFS